jgi:FAD:protein FMN transferase
LLTSGDYTRSVALMGTVVTIGVIGRGGSQVEQSVERAFDWFQQIENVCTRFEQQSEVMQLAAQPGVAAPVSAILFEAVRFALAVAEQSSGAFDPTVGRAMEDRGFNQEYKSRRAIHTDLPLAESVTYRDVLLDSDRRTITLLRPLLLDLGAVAKGLAIDMAAKELAPFENFSVDAGGDIYVGGHNTRGSLWAVGIRHPRRPAELIDSLRLSNRAVCTSGDYERTTPSEKNGHHIFDPRTESSPHAVASVTVVAPTAILADAVATAAFVLGPTEGIRLCERLGLDALMFSPSLERHATQGMSIAHVS